MLRQCKVADWERSRRIDNFHNSITAGKVPFDSQRLSLLSRSSFCNLLTFPSTNSYMLVEEIAER